MAKPAAAYLTVPRFKPISWLIHGFGTGALKEEDFARTEGLAQFRLVIMRQLHSDIIHRLDSPPAARLSGDALITNAPGLLLVVRTADCLPVFLVDEGHRAVASVHCGWRGTRARILERTVREMEAVYGTIPENLIAALGPCVGPACYEVGPDVREGFGKAGFPPSVFSASPAAPGKSLLDLRRANTWLLEGLGVKKGNILSVEYCTHCDHALLSYRRNKGEPQRMYNFVGIR